MGAASCCEPSDSKDETVIPKVAEQYVQAGTGEDVKAFDISPSTDPAKQEPAGGTSDSQAYRGRAGAMLISLDRSSESNIGLNLDALDGRTAFVDGILPGAVASWNREHPGIARLTAHDRIVAVNACSGETDRILRAMRTDMKWDVIVDRPVEVKIFVDCHKYPHLGLDLKYSPKCGTLLIAGIGEGAAMDWNLTTDGPKIVAGDRVVEINKVRGTAMHLLDAATDAKELTIIVLHYLSNDNCTEQD